MIRKNLALFGVAALVAGCAMTPAQRAPLKLTVLHTNDHHGRFWPNSDGEYGLAARKTLIDNVRAEVKAAGGRLDVAPLSANLYDGSLAGALSVNANNNQVALKQNLANVNINPLMKDALDKDVLEGRGNVALDVATTGTTVTVTIPREPRP